MGRPRLLFESQGPPRIDDTNPNPQSGRAIVEAATSIYVTSNTTNEPVHVALLKIDGRRVFAKLDHAPGEEEAPEEVLAGQRVKLLVKDDGDHYFQLPRQRGIDLGSLARSIRNRVTGSSNEE